MINIKEQKVENDELITVYENGVVIRSTISDPPPEPSELEKPTNPILKIMDENKRLKNEMKEMQRAMAEMSMTIAMKGGVN